MHDLRNHLEKYLEYCSQQKCLDAKTLKAYRIDLAQFSNSMAFTDITSISSEHLEHYISMLHQQYKPKTSKRKIASIKAFFHYLEYKDIIEKNPFTKLRIKFREPVILKFTFNSSVWLIFIPWYRDKIPEKKRLKRCRHYRASFCIRNANLRTMFPKSA